MPSPTPRSCTSSEENSTRTLFRCWFNIHDIEQEYTVSHAIHARESCMHACSSKDSILEGILLSFCALPISCQCSGLCKQAVTLTDKCIIQFRYVRLAFSYNSNIARCLPLLLHVLTIMEENCIRILRNEVQGTLNTPDI